MQDKKGDAAKASPFCYTRRFLKPGNISPGSLLDVSYDERKPLSQEKSVRLSSGTGSRRPLTVIL